MTACASSGSNVTPPDPNAGLYAPAPEPFFPAPCVAHWGTADLPLLLVTDSEQLASVIRDTAITWNAAIGMQVFVPLGNVDELGKVSQGRIVSIVYGVPEDPNHAGVTGFALTPTCQILRAETVVRFSDDLDYTKTVVLHELGHVLGLAHSRNNRATMAPTASKKPFWVEAETLAALRRIYSTSEDSESSDESDSGGSDSHMTQ